MRILIANATMLGDEVADLLVATNPTIAAITSLAPADVCAIAPKLSLRYAIQSWDAPHTGKAIMWKSEIPLQRLYRVEFGNANATVVDRNGVLRATLLWDGRPLHVFCTQFSLDPSAANWQLAQAARELEAVSGTVLFAIDPGCANLPAWSNLVDAGLAAPWRSISFPRGFDLADAARSAFGVALPSAGQTLSKPETSVKSSPLRLLCSSEFSVVRVREAPAPRKGVVAPLVVDLTAAASDEIADSPLPTITGARAETYSA